LIRQIVARQPAWQNIVFSVPNDLKLAAVALSDQPGADEAAAFIGHVRSDFAVQALVGGSDPLRSLSALTLVLESAGNLPDSVPPLLRLRALINVLFQQLTANANRLLQAYVVTALGCLIGFSIYVYSIYRLPVFMDTTRFLVSFERGAVLGALFSFGLFSVRAIARRLTVLTPNSRLIAGIGAGSICLILAIFGYDILYLDLLPAGWLIPLGAVFIAASAGAGAQYLRPRWQRMIADAFTLVLVIVISWRLYLSTAMHPLLFFEFTMPLTQVVAIGIITALPIAIAENSLDV